MTYEGGSEAVGGDWRVKTRYRAQKSRKSIFLPTTNTPKSTQIGGFTSENVDSDTNSGVFPKNPPNHPNFASGKLRGLIRPPKGSFWPGELKILYTTLLLQPPCWADISRFWAKITKIDFPKMP